MPVGTDKSFEISLKNAEGVPILHIGGLITKTALRAIKSTLDRLASAGHYHIVLNIERADAPNWSFLGGLSSVVRKIRSHYGAVDVVATRERIQQLAGMDRLGQLFRFCVSDGQAISRIKRLRRQPERISGTSARLSEKP